MSDNFYNILGINEKATADEIKKAYRTLQMKYHPDKNQSSQESINMTQKINEAYETLGDSQKREEYDFTRSNPNPFMRMNSSGGGGGMDVPIDDLFKMFFNFPGMPGMAGPGMGGQGGFQGMGSGGFPGMPGVRIFHGGPMGFQEAIQKPSPIVKTLVITMDQVLSGATIPLDIEKWVIDNGLKVHELETIYVTVPAGIDENEIIVLRDKGNVLNEQVKGDVKIFIKINNDTKFKRSGLDLIFDKKITLKEALCGFSFEIKYINGKSYTLNNNKGNIIPPDYKKVYQGMGLTRGEHKGNMIIHFQVEFPESLNAEQIERLTEVL
jgi:DnaJ-class molecular chaperone